MHKIHLITKMLKVMLNVKKNKSILITACIFITLQLSYSIAKLNSANNAEVEITNRVEARIAKDLARLPLPNPIDSSEGNNFVVESYIERLNKEIRNN